jgi:hypothetical protein
LDKAQQFVHSRKLPGSTNKNISTVNLKKKKEKANKQTNKHRRK